ncbi:hypothetical protein WJX72_012034 [[Myrmecia] bisecta]|uniref:Myb-like domain-containing protein n=1 Tax=[Myrmecia] bisecta TaxID=41462 RepID=A0AAW1PQV4_9CHLO
MPWTEEDEVELVRLVLDDDYRECVLGKGVAEDNWGAIAAHLGRYSIRANGFEGSGAYYKYWSLQHGYAGDGTVSGQKKRPRTNTPYALMVASALEQLPGRQGTVRDIRDIIAASPAYASMLDWTLQEGKKEAPRWHSSYQSALKDNPKLFERAGKRASKHGELIIWKLRDIELVEQLRRKHSTTAAMPHLGKKHR